MTDRPKLLLLDDDPDMLEIYREILQRLPSGPEIQTATSGTKAIALLEKQSFQIIVADLSMPRMDGMEVLTVVRRRWPKLSTVLMTAVVDEQLIKRAQAIGVDLCTRKPGTSREIEAFLAAIDDLVDKGSRLTGLVPEPDSRGRLEIPRLEPPSHTPPANRPISSASEGRVASEPATARQGRFGGDALNILHFRPSASGGASIAEPARPERHFNGASAPEQRRPDHEPETGQRVASSAAPAPSRAVPASQLAGVDGVEMVLSIRVSEGDPQVDSWGVEHPEEVGHWMYTVMRNFHALGERLQTGKLTQVDCLGTTQHWAVVPRGEDSLLMGLRRTLGFDQVRNIVKQLTTKWAS